MAGYSSITTEIVIHRKTFYALVSSRSRLHVVFAQIMIAFALSEYMYAPDIAYNSPASKRSAVDNVGAA